MPSLQKRRNAHQAVAGPEPGVLVITLLTHEEDLVVATYSRSHSNEARKSGLELKPA